MALTPGEIANYAAQAGFRGVGLVTAVAVALAESGGDPNAHCLGCSPSAPSEDSRGLWQINVEPAANPQYASSNLYDPLTNAKIAYQMSGGGSAWGAWTTFTGGAYKAFINVAQAAVAAMGTPLNTPAPAPNPTAGQRSGAPTAIDTPLGPVSIPTPTLPSVVPNVGKTFNDLTGALGSIANSVNSGVTDLVNFGRWVGQPQLWVRLGMILLGFVLIVVGLVLFAGSFGVKLPAVVPI